MEKNGTREKVSGSVARHLSCFSVSVVCVPLRQEGLFSVIEGHSTRNRAPSDSRASRGNPQINTQTRLDTSGNNYTKSDSLH